MEAQEAVAVSAAGEGTNTVPKMFAAWVAARGARVSLRQKQLGLWHSVSWTEFGQFAREIGLGLAALGFAPGECG